MKHLLFFILAIILTSKAYSQTGVVQVKWHTITEAEQLNKVKPKKFMIDVYTDWCGWCKRMDAGTFTNPIIAEYLNNNFYAVKFNAESADSIFFGGKTFVNAGGSRSTHQLAKALLKDQLSYPTIVYLNEKLELLGPIPGYKTPEALEAWLVFVNEEKYVSLKFDDFVATFTGKIKPTAQ